MATIGIVGMGKMGQAILAIMDTRPHLRGIAFQRLSAASEDQLAACQVVIEFTTADAAPGVIRHCLERRIPVVSGTTGWHEYHLESILSYARQQHSKLLYATNFSIGMNIVFGLNRKLAEVMRDLPQYKPSVREVHHIHKKDSPSGTAYTLLGDIIKQHPGYSGFALNPGNEMVAADQIPVVAVREGEVKGLHQVYWTSGAEQIMIAHEAYDRSIFAEGAILAAVWLTQQPNGIYTMKDVLGL